MKQVVRRIAVVGALALGVTAVLLGHQGSPVKSSVAAVNLASTRASATRALEAALRTVGPLPGQRAPHHVAAIKGLTQVQYYNWSGYANDHSGGLTYTSVSATWSQPGVTCPKDEDLIVVFWVGLDGFTTNTVEQDGTLAWCFRGTALYYSWWEMFPTNNIQIVGSTVAPNDAITALVSFAAGNYNLKLTDTTHPANSFTKSAKCGAGQKCLNQSAEWIVETPGGTRGLWPWPNFGTWKLANAKVTAGKTHGVIDSFPDDEITIVDTDSNSLATTGALNAAGNAFADAWKYEY